MEMDKLWERIRKSVTEGAQFAAEKTEELTKLGRAKIDILNTKRKISKAFAELGGKVYDGLKDGNAADVLTDVEIVALIESLKTLEGELNEKEQTYEEMTQKSEDDK